MSIAHTYGQLRYYNRYPMILRIDTPLTPILYPFVSDGPYTPFHIHDTDIFPP